MSGGTLYIPVFITMISLCVLTFLLFIAAIIYLRCKYETSLDRFQMFSAVVFLAMVACTSVEGALGINYIQSYDIPEVQLFESVNTSLFFLFVITLTYRMRGL